MNGDRTLRHPPHLQSAKLAVAGLVDAFGGQVAAAAETGKSQSRICAYGLPNTPDFAPLDVIDALEARTVGAAGHPHVTAWLARRRGFELVKLPDPSAPPMRLTDLVSATVQASGQLTTGVLNALDGACEIDAAHAWRLLKDAGELVRIAVELEAAIKDRAGGS